MNIVIEMLRTYAQLCGTPAEHPTQLATQGFDIYYTVIIEKAQISHW